MVKSGWLLPGDICLWLNQGGCYLGYLFMVNQGGCYLGIFVYG